MSRSNQLYYDDCLTVMQDKLGPGSTDLIYLDPPFNSNRAYNAIYKNETGRPLPEQVEAFCDQWTLDGERIRAIEQLPVLMRKSGIDDDTAEFWRLWMKSLRRTDPRLLAYLSYMTERLLPMRGILKPTGSIYLHCDSTASHYIKVMLHGVFGKKNFLGDIIWNKCNGVKSKTHWGNENDNILCYAINKGKHTFNSTDPVYRTPFSDISISMHFKKTDKQGRHYRERIVNGKSYIYYAREIYWESLE